MVTFSASGLRLKPKVLAKVETKLPVFSVTGRLRLATMPNTVPLIWAAVVTVEAEGRNVQRHFASGSLQFQRTGGRVGGGDLSGEQIGRGGFFPVAGDAEAIASRTGDVERVGLEPGVHRPRFRQGGDVLRSLGEGQTVQIELIGGDGNLAGNSTADLSEVGSS